MEMVVMVMKAKAKAVEAMAMAAMEMAMMAAKPVVAGVAARAEGVAMGVETVASLVVVPAAPEAEPRNSRGMCMMPKCLGTRLPLNSQARTWASAAHRRAGSHRAHSACRC